MVITELTVKIIYAVTTPVCSVLVVAGLREIIHSPRGSRERRAGLWMAWTGYAILLTVLLAMAILPRIGWVAFS